MSERNGTSNGQVSPRARLREARAAVGVKRAEIELKLLESFGFWTAPWSPVPFDGAPGGGQQWIPLGPQGGTGGRLGDRREGGDRPFLWNEVDLVRSRSVARWLCNTNMLAQGVVESLCDYTAGTGFDFSAQPGRRFLRDRTAHELAALIQEVIEEFQSLNTLNEEEGEELPWAEREWEAVYRSVCDGEVCLRTFDQGDTSTLVRFVEPEQIQQPLGSPPEWSWGRRSPPGDAEKATSYAIHYEDPDDWEEVPAGEISFLKRNTPSTVKRGLSDFYGTSEALHEVQKLLTALRVSGTAQANIAWIEQHAGANQSGLNALIGKARNQNTLDFIDPLTGGPLNVQTVRPGQRLLVGEGREYQPAPLAANTTQHINIVDASLRALGARWRMPSYMIAGDASQANYASTLVSGSPFVKRVETRQAVYGRFFVRVLWQAIRNAARRGRFRIGGRTFAWEEVSRLVDIAATPPAVAISDKTAEARSDAADIAAGVMSLQTRRARVGLDDEVERKNLAEEPPTRVAGRATDLDAQGNPVGKSGQPGGQDNPNAQGMDKVGDTGLRATVGGLNAIAGLQADYYAGKVPRAAAVANAKLLFGFSDAEAASLFPEEAPVKLAPEPAAPAAPEPGGPPAGMRESKDASGHEHKGKGEGGGQFAAGGGGGGTNRGGANKDARDAPLRQARQAIHDHAKEGERLEDDLKATYWDHPAVEKVSRALETIYEPTFKGSMGLEHDKDANYRRDEFKKLARLAERAASEYATADLSKDPRDEAERGGVLHQLRRVKLYAERGLRKVEAVRQEQRKLGLREETLPERLREAKDASGRGHAADAPKAPE